MTTRGAKEDMMHLIAELIEEVLNAPEDEKVIARVHGTRKRSFPTLYCCNFALERQSDG